jgi:hypothetical protein
MSVLVYYATTHFTPAVLLVCAPSRHGEQTLVFFVRSILVDHGLVLSFSSEPAFSFCVFAFYEQSFAEVCILREITILQKKSLLCFNFEGLSPFYNNNLSGIFFICDSL